MVIYLALMVTNNKYKVDIFLGIDGPEGVLAASALDLGCKSRKIFI